MVNGVSKAELQEEDGGLLEESAKVDDLDELIASGFRERVEIFRVSLFVPSGDFGGRFDVLGNSHASGIEYAIEYGLDEEIISDCDVASEFDGGLGASIGLVGTLVGWNGFEDFLGGAAFILHGAKKKVVKQCVSLFCGHFSHGESPCRVSSANELVTLVNSSGIASPETPHSTPKGVGFKRRRESAGLRYITGPYIGDAAQ